MSEERNPVSPEALAAAWATWHERHGGKLGPGPAFTEALAAGMAVDLAAAREAGRLEGLEEGYMKGLATQAVRIEKFAQEVGRLSLALAKRQKAPT